MSARCITPAHSLFHASGITPHELVAESGVSLDDLLVMSQPSLVPAPSPHQEHAVRFELTMTGFADQRLNQLGYACERIADLSQTLVQFEIRNSEFEIFFGCQKTKERVLRTQSAEAPRSFISCLELDLRFGSGNPLPLNQRCRCEQSENLCSTDFGVPMVFT